jgi:hypothetical protein
VVGKYALAMADLHDVHAKLERAQLHAREFDAMAQQIIDSRPFSFEVKVEEDDWCHIRWKQNGEFPNLEPLAVVFGDFLYNLRATLDYIIWQLVLLNGRKPGRHTSFPCVLEAAKWHHAVNGALRGVGQPWVAQVAKLQPFDPSHTTAPHSHPLAVLDEANNMNKHRLLPAALMSAGYAAHEFHNLPPEATQMQFFFNDIPVADGEDHFRFAINREANVGVTVDPNPRYRIAFAGVPGGDWRNWDLVNWVRSAITVFEPAFS